ncbi:hypothetical protein LZP69_15335 [Shewanella sp. AS1]|uniref:hypothetical protein n=1 Tax=Shewanella sp. AS1 TaxID=2907626 RepID=UPI001F2BEBA0|nr:hypothetical protein [Shewanella sp. AS1]MCE9680526.1 hypothetical protein [Shewanella sp. AS1]
MFWQITFWLLCAIFVLPVPFKIAGYLSGKDPSPLSVKVEEMANLAFTAIGLVAFYGFISDQSYFSPLFWQIWLVIALIWSISSFFWSPKLTYAAELFGKHRMYLLASISITLYSPLLLAVYFYAC